MKTMNLEMMQKMIAEAVPVWNCNFTVNEYEVGCPHKVWTAEELQRALVTKKKWEAAKLRGKILTDS